ncbi:hypothetical protein [Gemmatimonas phototrophica]|uniref:hypothetical protein n=1 Tax=Gemmatimonas phototrophica TaxID=1379270 RepID=UPI00131408C4|nr:hypothetical protein [Gemmatimonas phototrophica]
MCNSQCIASRPAGRRVAVAGIALLVPFLSACGLWDVFGRDQYVVRVDSVSVAPFASGGAIATYHGLVGGNSCSRLLRTERVNRAPDTLAVRFIAESENGDCLAMPTRLVAADTLAAAPARSVTLKVQQPDGSALVRRVTLPFSAP